MPEDTPDAAARPAPRHSFIPTRGGPASVYRWPGSHGGGTVLLLHATGFHARIWDSVIRRLPSHLTIIAPDLRGHGRSPNREPEPRWLAFALDIVDIIDNLALSDVIGAGHSMGGFCLAAAAHARSEAFRHLVLIDPVISEPAVYNAENQHRAIPATEHPVARRRNEWPSWQAFRDSIAGRSPFDLWTPETLDDYCRHALRLQTPDTPDAAHAEDPLGYELACSPLFEATIYVNRRNADILHLLPGIATPVDILRAPYEPFDPDAPVDFRRSTTWPGLTSLFADARDHEFTHLTHFIPMQEPTLVATHIASHTPPAIRT